VAQSHPILRWVFFLVALGMWFTGVSLLIGGLADIGSGSPDAAIDGAIVAMVFGVLLFAASWFLGMLSFPAFTAISGIVLAPVAVFTGLGLAVAATAFGRADSTDYSPDRAAAGCWVGCVLCLVVAVALTANWRVWLRRPGSSNAVHHVLVVAAIGWGSLLVMNGLAGAVYAMATMIQVFDTGGDETRLMNQAVATAGSSMLALLSGVILLWHGAAALTGVGAARYLPMPLWKPALAAAASIAIGAVLLQTQTAVGLMPLAHVVAVIAPGLTILTLVSRARRASSPSSPSTWREVLLMVAYGIAVAATIAAIVNTLALGLEFSSAFTIAGEHTLNHLGDSALVVLLLIGLSVLVPLDEEFCKGFGVRLLRRHNPTRYQAFLWGLASGVGFGAVEAAEYGYGAFAQSAYRWWDGVLLRGAASSLHALASGMVGIAWFYMFQGQKRKFAGFYLLAVGLHGSWNALNLLTVTRVVPGLRHLSSHDLEIGLEVFLGILAVGIIAFLWNLAKSLAKEDEVGGTPPPASPPVSCPEWESLPAPV
jgi:RsiW-degrading membrane proteinase PrsW (M82 family)